MPDTDTRTRISSLTLLVKAADHAMEAEEVSDDIRRRVMNRLIYGSPEGPGR